MRYYISIAKNTKTFELHKPLFAVRGITGVRADNMSAGIEKAIEIEKSEMDELYFVVIASDDIVFMPQLKTLRAETSAPILVATSNPNNSEYVEALTNGADYYERYYETPEQNVDAVIATLTSVEQRAEKNRMPLQIVMYKDLFVDPDRYQHGVFIGDKKIDLTRHDFEILYYLMKNRGKVLTYRQIYSHVWGVEYEDTARDVLRNAIKRLREKLRIDHDSPEYIKTVIDVGYCFPLENDK